MSFDSDTVPEQDCLLDRNQGLETAGGLTSVYDTNSYHPLIFKYG
ncbi:MAG: hypothetical protein H6Q49_1408 [Deltaproteobacteria bacterium]|nr:hypothetical protein [Deltaproteobacteria bacterium]